MRNKRKVIKSFTVSKERSKKRCYTCNRTHAGECKMWGIRRKGRTHYTVVSPERRRELKAVSATDDVKN